MSEDSIGTTKILQSTKLRQTFEMAMQDNKTSLQYKQIIQSFFFDPNVQANYLNIVIDAEMDGRDLNVDAKFRRKFEVVARNQFNLKFSNMDPLSLLGAMDFTTSDSRFLSWGLVNKEIFLRVAGDGNGAFSTITGTPGSGKSDIALTIAKINIEAGKRVLTNIMVKDDVWEDGDGNTWFLDSPIRHVTRVSDFLRIVLEGSPVDTVLIIDEAGLFWNKKEAMTRRNRQWEKLARVLRKFRTNLVFVVQESYNIPPQIMSFRSVIIHKYSKKRARFEFKNGAGSFDCFISNIPKTSVRFDSMDISFFKFDVDLDKLLGYISSSKSAKGQRAQILKFIEKKDGGGPDKGTIKLEKQIVNYKLEHPKATQRDIATVLECSQTRVSEILIKHNLSKR